MREGGGGDLHISYCNPFLILSKNYFHISLVLFFPLDVLDLGISLFVCVAAEKSPCLVLPLLDLVAIPSSAPHAVFLSPPPISTVSQKLPSVLVSRVFGLRSDPKHVTFSMPPKLVLRSIFATGGFVACHSRIHFGFLSRAAWGHSRLIIWLG
jgi:hypothetical protein